LYIGATADSASIRRDGAAYSAMGWALCVAGRRMGLAAVERAAKISRHAPENRDQG